MAESAVDFEVSLLALLKADDGLKSLVKDKIYALYIPEGTKLPCVTFQRIEGVPANTLQGASGLEAIDLQIDAWGRTYAEAKKIAKAIRAAMPPTGDEWGAHLQRDQDLFEEDSSYFRVLMLYRVWFLENYNS